MSNSPSNRQKLLGDLTSKIQVEDEPRTIGLADARASVSEDTTEPAPEVSPSRKRSSKPASLADEVMMELGGKRRRVPTMFHLRPEVVAELEARVQKAVSKGQKVTISSFGERLLSKALGLDLDD